MNFRWFLLLPFPISFTIQGYSAASLSVDNACNRQCGALIAQGREMPFIAGHLNMDLTTAWATKLTGLKQKEKLMSENTHLYVLWTNDNLITAEKMVFMYTVNSLVHGWWDQVTLIIWGATAKLVNDNTDIQEQIKKAQDAGVHVTVCKACADQLGVTETLEKLNIEVKYWGVPLTKVLTNGEKLLTI